MQNKSKMLITIIACLAVQLCIGILYLWSVFRSPVATYFNWAPASASLVSSYMIFGFVTGNMISGFAQIRLGAKKVALIGCIMFCGGLIISSFVPQTSPTMLYFTYSAISGLGCGFAYGSALFCVISWMPHRRGFASGLSVSAFGFSTVVFSPVAQLLLRLESFGANSVPMTFRTLGVTFMVITVIACLFIQLPDQAYIKSLNLPAATANVKNVPPGQTLKTWPFWSMIISMFTLTALWMILLPLIRDLGAQKGLTDTLALFTVSMTGVANAAGRLLLASLSDKLGRVRTVQMIALFTGCASIGLMFFGGAIYSFLVLLAAFSYGGMSSVFPAVTGDLYGPKYASSNYGIILFALGISSITYTALSNMLIASTASYTYSFLIAAVSGFVPFILIMSVNGLYREKAEAAAKAVTE